METFAGLVAGGIAGGEEFVAGCTELLPELFALLAGNRTYFLPFLLEGEEGVRGGLPVGAGLEFLSTADDIEFLAYIFIRTALVVRVELTPAGEKCVACRAETLVDTLVFLFRRETDLALVGLHGLYLLSIFIELLQAADLTRRNLFHLLAKGGLGLEVLFLLLLQALEMRLVALVYH